MLNEHVVPALVHPAEIDVAVFGTDHPPKVEPLLAVAVRVMVALLSV